MRDPVKGLAILLISALLATASLAATHIVPDEYPTISMAINAAQMGDTVLVNPGLYYEAVSINPGLAVMSSERWAASIFAPSMYECPVTLLPPSSPNEEEALTEVVGFDIQQLYDFGNPAICGGNPKAEVKDCRIAHAGPGGNTEIPCIFMPAGGIIKMCEISHGGSSKAIYSNQPGAEILVEDCILVNVFMMGVTGFGSGSVTTFKNNNFYDPILRLEVLWPPTDFTMIFVNNIFYDGGPNCPLSGLMPDSLVLKYNDFWPWADPDCPEGLGNFMADPLFCDEPDHWLQPESPCLGAGEHGEDVGARWGICYPTSVDIPQRMLGPSLIVSPTVVDAGGCAIQLSLDSDAPVPGVEILDVLGRRCAVLRLGSRGVGVHSIRWDGTDNHGRGLPSGVYWIRPQGLKGLSAKVLILQ
jgi:hypothetical protein